MTHTAEAVTAVVLAAAAIVTTVAAGVWTWRQARPTPAPQLAQRPPADAYRPCHTTACGHMTTPHDRTPAGLVCRGCGTTNNPSKGGH